MTQLITYLKQNHNKWTERERTWDWGGVWREGDNWEETEASSATTAETVNRFVLIFNLFILTLLGWIEKRGFEVVGRRTDIDDVVDDDANMFIVARIELDSIWMLKWMKERQNQSYHVLDKEAVFTCTRVIFLLSFIFICWSKKS